MQVVLHVLHGLSAGQWLVIPRLSVIRSAVSSLVAVQLGIVLSLRVILRRVRDLDVGVRIWDFVVRVRNVRQGVSVFGVAGVVVQSCFVLAMVCVIDKGV